MILWSVLIIGTILYRIMAPFVGWLPNFAPVMAIAFCAAAYSGRKSVVWMPLIALALSDIVLNVHYGVSVLTLQSVAAYGCYILAACLGVWVSQRRNLATLALGTLVSAILFYLVTNSICWLDNPVYVKSLAGWVQALTVGQPGLPPTVYFFRNSLAGDLVFALYFVVCMELANWRAGRPSLFAKKAVV